ncbi:MAG: TIR domain-containing protein [Desulfomonile tiedjei]|nr:TIR domain-containing protein [Desulfomonile tiedjei]
MKSKPRGNLGEAEYRIRKALETESLDLDLAGLLLTELPESIGQLSHLQDLNLQRNGLTEFPESFANLNSLRRLDAQSNEFKTFPEAIRQLRQLRTLVINRNRLTTLPEFIGQLSQLECLFVVSTDLTKLPESIGQLSNLHELNVSFNSLAILPECIGGLLQLQVLKASHNQLSTLPEWIGTFSQLEELDVSGNPLAILPECIGGLLQLQVLKASHNQLSMLPEWMGKLSQLKELDVSGNQLTILPESVGKLAQLQKLKISRNQLSTLPEWIGELSQLKELIVPGNQLTTLPESVGKLSQLRQLYVYSNQLKTLPESIGKISRLQLLDASMNHLKTLPESIGKLWRLWNLDLTQNQLNDLPESLKSLGSLGKLHLHGNSELGLPQELLDLSSSDAPGTGYQGKTNRILEYYFRMRVARRPLNEAKLILVGRGAAGKTSIVNRLVYDRFDGHERKTEGIQITEWKLPLNESENVRLNIWDFGGQEIMHATHQFFLTQRSLYLLVLDGRGGGEEADAEYWLKLIESFGRDSPVVIVLNKIKEHPFDINRRAFRQKFPAIRDFIRTDCEDGTGIEQLLNAIKLETDSLEHLRDAFPASWFRIKDRVGGMKKNYLSFDEYRKLCARLGEKDPAAQESLAFYLHSLGIALNYKDDPRLQDMHVLNPRWVTSGLYTILNSNKLVEQKGDIRLRDIPGILTASEYPARMHLFLFDLMKKFDLCFSYPDDDAHYLIPELLDKQEPEASAAFKAEECLNFQYHYPVLPEGLLPRFIVRTHAVSEGHPRWRTGVILRFEGNVALVKADAQDKKVFISVSGPVPGRRRLLAVIRSDCERIHRDISNLNPEAMVPLPDYPNVVVSYDHLLVMEKRGIKKFTQVVGNEVIELGVDQLLNGVDLDRTGKKDRTEGEFRQRVRLFYSYSHKDESLCDQLETHLKILERRGLVESWQDRKIEAGDEWKERIDENLEAADIILLLVSANFIASDYCYEKEMKRALERDKNKEARVVPIIVRDCSWKKSPFAKLQALPKNGKAVTKWRDKDSAWRNVADGIEEVIEETRKKPQ